VKYEGNWTDCLKRAQTSHVEIDDALRYSVDVTHRDRESVDPCSGDELHHLIGIGHSSGDRQRITDVFIAGDAT
jgi:hypothetical protein